jgi:hypothetical protein
MDIVDRKPPSLFIFHHLTSLFEYYGLWNTRIICTCGGK